MDADFMKRKIERGDPVANLAALNRRLLRELKAWKRELKTKNKKKGDE
jgi:hypothetical protein